MTGTPCHNDLIEPAHLFEFVIGKDENNPIQIFPTIPNAMNIYSLFASKSIQYRAEKPEPKIIRKEINGIEKINQLIYIQRKGRRGMYEIDKIQPIICLLFRCFPLN